VVLYSEKFYYYSVEKIRIGLISDKNIRFYTCGLLQSLGETLLGKTAASIFAITNTSEGLLLYWVRMERLLPVRARSVFFGVFRLYNQSSSDNRVAVQMEHAATFLRHDYTYSRAHAYLPVEPYVSFGQHRSRRDGYRPFVLSHTDII
jgi:hypothetical protein